jgi:hypothetical protein
MKSKIVSVNVPFGNPQVPFDVSSDNLSGSAFDKVRNVKQFLGAATTLVFLG